MRQDAICRAAESTKQARLAVSALLVDSTASMSSSIALFQLKKAFVFA
jgi:hypothetical protein